MAEKQGINFYELGRKSGATTSKTQQSGFQSLVGSIDKTVSGMLNSSKAATAALTAAMPSGVAIEKVPEQLRGQVSKYLADNKKAYTDAAAVVASGINPQSQRYKEAVEKMNSVSTKFENLSNNLESIAVSRKAALDDPNYSAMTTDEDALIYNNLANGSLYETMNINDDGTFNYKDAQGNSKLFKDFRVEKQGFTGQQTYLGLVENAQEMAGKKGMKFETLEGRYKQTIDSLFDKLGPRGSLDYAFADDTFMQEYLGKEENKGKNLNDLKKNPGNLVETYKQYNMDQLRNEYDKAPKYEEPKVKLSPGEEAKRQKKSQIKNEFDSFMKPQRIQEGQNVKYEYTNPLQVAQYLNNLMPDRTFEFQYDDNGVGGYYTRRKSGTTETGKKIDWELVATEQGLTFDVIDNYIDYNNYALD